MLRNRLFHVLKTAYQIRKPLLGKVRTIAPVSLGLLTTAACAEPSPSVSWDDTLGHDFLIRQATTVNVNAATQLLTVTLVAIQDTSERLRDALSKEICLVQQAIEWGAENTPPQHWDQLVDIRNSLCDLKYNLRMLFSYMDYAEKLATVAAEISYLSGNIAASDAICERIDHVCRTCKSQRQMNHDLQQESLQVQQQAIVTSPHLQDKLSESTVEEKHLKPT